MSSFFINLDIVTDERYALSKFMEFTDNYDPLTSIFLKQLTTLPYYAIREIGADAERIDLFAYKYMGNSDLWWILLAYNQKLSFDEIKIGNVVKIPSPDSLEALFFRLKEMETVAKR